MGANKMCELAVVIAVVMAVMMAGVGEAQNTPSCASQLTDCVAYLNSTSPPANCCTPLKTAVENEKDCLCNLYNDPGFLQSVGINVTEALQLPKHCGITEELNCNASTQSPTGSPPATPGKDEGGASMVAWTGISSLLLLCASLML